MIIDSLDLETKRIYLATGVREYHPVEDIYREIRTLRRTDESLRGFDVPVTAAGNVAKGGGKYTPRYATFRNGWRVVPEDSSHVLNVTGEQITDDGQGGTACFDLTPLSASSKVIIQYEPPAAEVIEAGSAVTEQDKADIANRVWEETLADHTTEATSGETLKIIQKILRNKTVTDPDAGTITVYDDDGSVLLTADLYENASGAQKYRGKGAERIERLT